MWKAIKGYQVEGMSFIHCIVKELYYVEVDNDLLNGLNNKWSFSKLTSC